jgi:acetate kinase
MQVRCRLFVHPCCLFTVSLVLQALKNAAEDLTTMLETTERDMRRESAVPQVKDAVAGVLIAIRQGDKVTMKKRSDDLNDGGNRAIEVALQRKERAVDPALVDSYVHDLQQIQPLHREATLRAVEMATPDKPTLRRVAEMARDVLGELIVCFRL